MGTLEYPRWAEEPRRPVSTRGELRFTKGLIIRSEVPNRVPTSAGIPERVPLDVVPYSVGHRPHMGAQPHLFHGQDTATSDLRGALCGGRACA